MPIIRRDETSDPLDKYIALIWSRKWLIIGVGLLAGLLTYVALWFVPETFRVTSEIFVNRLPTLGDEETANPDTVASLLKSQSVIEEVRNEYVAAFNLEESPPIERFAKQFEVESEVLQDTTVRKQLSPVLSLQVEASGSSETRFIMDSWITNFIQQFGNYTTREAVIKRDAFLAERQKLENEIARREELRAQYDAQLPQVKKVLAEKLDLLTPSRLLFQEQDVDTIKLDFQIQNPRTRPGLLERSAELRLQMSTGSAPTTAAAELRAIDMAIADANTSIAAAEKELADIRFKQIQNARLLQQLADTQKAVSDAYSRFAVASAVYKETSEAADLPAGGDIRALSVPVAPESRVWPKRTLTAGIVAVVASLLTIFAIIARNFLTRVSVRENQ